MISERVSDEKNQFLLFEKRRSSKTLIIFVENKYPDNRLLVQTRRRSILIYYFTPL